MFKERGPKKIPKPTSSSSPEILDEDIKLGSDGEEDTITFSSDEDREAKIRRLGEMRKKAGMMTPTELSLKEKANLLSEEKQLRKDVMRAELNFGEFTKERAAALHAYGRNLFKQQRFDQIYDLSLEILAIHESIDGVDSIETARALTNVGSTAWKVGKTQIAQTTALRMLAIHMAWDYSRDKDEDAKEKATMMAKARLASYQYPEHLAQQSVGITYQEYQDRMHVEKEKEKDKEDKKKEKAEL